LNHEKDSSQTAKNRGGCVLVVDDSEISRDFLKRELEQLGHTVIVAESGAQALGVMRQGVDLVLLDTSMPEMNGEEVLEHLKADRAWRDIPVIMISSPSEMESVAKCLEMGATDYLSQPFNRILFKSRVDACLERKRFRDQEAAYLQELDQLNRELEVSQEFIGRTFGNYSPDELVARLLERLEGLNLGGERRQVTILMSDLRGFTPITERLPPEQVMALLNIYLGRMAEVIMQYQGMINEFIGDAILAIFGAPIWRPDHAERAIACAVAMQLAMPAVNEQSRQAGLPEIAMGIGINTGEVVTGNTGSLKRTKYGVIGSQVNLTSRIESYSLGGQILVSEATRQAVGDILRIDGQMVIDPKGVDKPLTTYQIGGIGGEYNLFLPEINDPLVPLPKEIKLRYFLLEGKHTGRLFSEGRMVKLSPKRAEICAEYPVAPLSNIKLQLMNQDGEFLPGDLYGKVLGEASQGSNSFYLSFTSIAPELDELLQSWLRAI
jgi:class 3 adenylate cyclase/CheY-like chemotaxis protein